MNKDSARQTQSNIKTKELSCCFAEPQFCLFKDRQDKAMFISFCIEQYANAKNMSSSDVATLFEQYDITEYLYECYDVLHTQGHNWLIEDIDEMINNRKQWPKYTTEA